MRKVLFVYPEGKLHNLYKGKLSEFYTVQSAFDGLQGVRFLPQIKPQAVVSAYDLPKLSGLGLLDFVRKSKIFSHLPFVFISASDLNEQSLTLGANQWLKTSKTSPDDLAFCLERQIKLTPYYV